MDSDDSDNDFDESSEGSDDIGRGKLRIEFKNDYLAEAVDDDLDMVHSLEDEVEWEWKAEETITNLEVFINFYLLYN